MVGFDDHGRALISGYRNGRRPGLYWAGGITVTPYWVPDDALIDALGAYQWDGLRFFVSGGGHVAAWGSLDSSLTETVYRVDSGSLVPIARAGDRDTQGATLGAIDAASINDNGVVAIGAQFTPANWACPDPEGDCYPPVGIYVAQDGALRRVAGEGDPSPWGAPFDSAQLVGLTRDNAVVFAAHTGGQGGGETQAARLRARGVSPSPWRHARKVLDR